MEFEAFPKVPRLNREIVITEKIDGTNAQIFILDKSSFAVHMWGKPGCKPDELDVDKVWKEEQGKNGAIVSGDYLIRAGSRNRWLASGSDNFGFWAWVYQNREGLAKLGLGRHFGEWWGRGIQRQYGLDHKRFSLFNTSRWGKIKDQAIHEKLNADGTGGHNPFNAIPELDVVPVLYSGPLAYPYGPDGGDMFQAETLFAPEEILWGLKTGGSKAAPGFMDPEGIMVFHTAANCMFKATVKDDEKPKQVTAKKTLSAEDGQAARAA